MHKGLADFLIFEANLQAYLSDRNQCELRYDFTLAYFDA